MFPIWSKKEQYEPGDWVIHRGRTYVCFVACKGEAPHPNVNPTRPAYNRRHITHKYDSGPNPRDPRDGTPVGEFKVEYLGYRSEITEMDNAGHKWRLIGDGRKHH